MLVCTDVPLAAHRSKDSPAGVAKSPAHRAWLRPRYRLGSHSQFGFEATAIIGTKLRGDVTGGARDWNANEDGHCRFQRA